jgi:methylmalonyl-CoA mutase C-terminal domain/subunit
MNESQSISPNPRILLTKSFIDSHDRAIATIAMALRDASMEVILIDFEVPEDVAKVAVQEDVDAIGLSFMSGGQVETTARIIALLEEQGLRDVPVVVGGVIRPFDVAPLEAAGVKAIFRGGASLADVVKVFRRVVVEYREKT